MSRGNKLRIFVCLMVIAFVVSIEYKTIYQVVVASPLVQKIVGDSVSDNTVQQDGNSSEGTEELPGSESVEVTIEDETEEGTGNETEGNVNEGTSIDFDEQEEEILFENEDETDTQSNGSSDESVSNEETGIFSVNPEESLSENTIAEELENVSAAYGESAIPTTLDAFITYYNSLEVKKVPLTTKQDWLNLQELSQVTSLEGYVFDIQDNNTTGDTNPKLYDLQNIGFTGIGCAEFPFKGTLTCYLDTGISVRTSVPVFAYLSGGSTVKNFSVISVDSIASVAGVLTGSGDVTLMNMTVCGPIKNQDGAAGGLFAEISNSSATPINVKIVAGTNGGVTFAVLVNSSEKVYPTISGDFSGALAGKVYGNVTFIYDEAVCNLSNISSITGLCGYDSGTYGANGLLFGKVEGDGTYMPEIVLTNTSQDATTVSFNLTEKILGEGINGGLIGYMQNATLSTNGKTVVLEGDKNKVADVRGGNAQTADTDTGIGGLIGILNHSTIKTGSKFLLQDMYVCVSANKSSKGCGGFFGGLIDSTIENTDDIVFKVNNSWINSESSSPCHALGGIAGFYSGKANTENLLSGMILNNVDIQSQKASPNASVGTIFGLYRGHDGNKLTLSNWTIKGILTTANKGNGTGGVVGCVKGIDGENGTAVLRINEGSIDTARNANYGINYISGSQFAIWDDANPIGGIVGIITTASCEISNVTITGLSLRSDSYTGGVIGEIKESANKKHVFLENITLGKIVQRCTPNSSTFVKGLLISKIGGNTIVKLDGTMDLSAAEWYFTDKNGQAQPYYINASAYQGNGYGYIGSIAGIQEKAVVYIDDDCEYTPYTKPLTTQAGGDGLVGYVDEIGNFGGAYRNEKWGDDTLVFEEDKILGTVPGENGTYQIGNVADLMRFSILLNSEGAFARECFGSESFDVLLKGTYNLTAVEYDLTGTGIVSLQRTIGKGTSPLVVCNKAVPEELTEVPEMFKGTFQGTAVANPAKIIHNISVYRHTNQGLFAYVGSESGDASTAVFKNLYIDETITQAASDCYKNNKWANAIAQNGSMGGLAVFAQGNVTVENCQLDIDMTSRMHKPGNGTTDPKTYFGGLFGKYIAFDGSNLAVNDIQATGEKVMGDNDHYVSQLIACVESPTSNTTIPSISLANIEVGGRLEKTNSREIDNSQNLDTSYLGGLIAVMNENKDDGTDEASWNATLGVENRHKKIEKRTNLTIDRVTIADFQLVNSPDAYRSSGLLGFRWLDIVADVKNVTVGDRADTTTTTETVTLKTNKRFGGLLNEASGRLEFTNVNINNTTVYNTNTMDYSALLVAESEYMYLSVTDYVVDPTTIIKRSDNKMFDEVAGVSKTRHENSDGSFSLSESTGAIVSISTSGIDKSLDVSDTGTYNGYQNKATYYTGYSASSAGSLLEVTQIQNAGARYYYDLPRIIGDVRGTGAIDIGTLTDGVISSPDELMRWSLIHYAVSDLRDYFVTDAEMAKAISLGGNIDIIRRYEYQISGEIDLGGYSYYPPNVSNRTLTGINNATIIFHAKDIIDKETALNNGYRYPYQEKQQQYLVHAALFNNVSQMEVSGLTLSGTISTTKYNTSGGLVCGSLSGVEAKPDSEDKKAGRIYSTEAYTNFTDICLKNLWVAREKTNTWSAPYGLMIAQITNGAKVNLDKIKMTDYVTSDTPTGETKAASALIGVVGTNGTTTDKYISEIELNFTNMDIADVADDTTVPDGAKADLSNATEEDKVLARASFIYCYQYYEDTCQGIYTFTKADYLSGKGIIAQASGDTDVVNISEGSGYITMGLEINSATEYIDEKIDTVILKDKYGFDNKNYKPYVYNYLERVIYVNPKPGHITEGCGTYEDPYVIRTANQLKSVYYYLKGQTAQLINWQVNAIGDDTTFCQIPEGQGSHTITVHGIDTTTFPSREQMRQAYYVVDPIADGEGRRVIDLSSFSEFVGLGSLQEPFVGVLVGKTDSNHSMPVVKLPGYVNNDEEVDSFGLIRYAKGCVVKDLNIELGTSETDGVTTTNYYTKVRSAGSGVIANVCGGDNIIDNVYVSGTLQTVALTENYSSAQIGGYVACVDLGTVILRNITNDSLKEFKIINADGESVAAKSAYIWTGGIVGRVKDGVVVYEGLSDETTPLASEAATFPYRNDSGLVASDNYGILNAKYFKENGNVAVDVDTTTGAITLNAENSGRLYLVAAALNSGCLTYQGATEVDLGIRNGYGADSRCRNGNYSTVGEVATSTADGDYQDARRYENLNGGQALDGTFFAPYLLDYFTLSSNSSAMLSTILISGGNSYNDSATKSVYLDLKANQLTLSLGNSGVYDMTVFGDSFRGIGAGYYKDENVFKGNVEGNQSTVEISYLSGQNLDIDDIGLFNTIRVEQQTDGCYMKDLTITGKLLNSKVISSVANLSDEVLKGDSTVGKSAAGLIGCLEVDSSLSTSGFPNTKYNYSFENIQVKDLTVEAQEYAAGMIAQVICIPAGGANSSYLNSLQFKECSVGIDNKADNVNIKGTADVGGIIACYFDPINVTFEKCQTSSTNLEAIGMHLYQRKVSTDGEYEWVERRVYPAAGGFIGRGVGTGKTITILGANYQTISLKTKGHMGGLIGETESTMTVSQSADATAVTGNGITFAGLGIESNKSLEDSQIEPGSTTETDAFSAAYNRTKYAGSFGGLVGFVSGPGTSIADVSIKNINGAINHGYKDQTFMGGLIGRLYQTGTSDYIFTACTIGSTDGDISMKAAAAKSDTNRVFTGGLIGGINCHAKTKITNCSVVGNEDGTSVLQSTDTAAGMVGLAKSYVAVNNLNNNIFYESCNVSNLTINGYVRTAGVEGKREYGLPNSTAIEVVSKFHNVKVMDCELYNMDEYGDSAVTNSAIVSGGLQGYTRGYTVAVDCEITNVHMKGKTTRGAGGLVGKCEDPYGYVRAANIKVSHSTIAGASAGGLVGISMRSSYSNSRVSCNFSQITLENNKIISHYYDSNPPQYAGGIYGYSIEYKERAIEGDNITLDGNLIAVVPTDSSNIVGRTYVGGIVGKMEAVSHFAHVTMKNNIVSMLDPTSIQSRLNDLVREGTLPENSTMSDYFIHNSFGIWDGYGNVTEAKVQDVCPVLFNSKDKTFNNYGGEFTEESDLLPYTQTVALLYGGAVLGKSNESRVYDLQVHYDDELRKYRPAVDLGKSDNNSISGLEYAYKIVYGKYEESEYINNQDAIGKVVQPAAYYQFGDLKKIWADYKVATDKKYAYHLENNSLLKNLSGLTTDSILASNYYDDEETNYQSIYVDEAQNPIPMLVYDNNQSLDVLVNTVIKVLTNNGGSLVDLNSAKGATITPKKMIIEDGRVRELTNGEGGEASVKVVQGNNNIWNLQINSNGYDVQTSGDSGTFTMLHVEYSYQNKNYSFEYNDTNGSYMSKQKQSMSLDIPIYIEKVLEYQNHITGVQGAEYYLNNLLANGKSSLQTLRDTYTAYVEYDYNDAYEKYNSQLFKEICFKDPTTHVAKNIPKNTKFVLIDITNQGHVYYYKTTENITAVSLSEFADSSGVAYEEQNVANLEGLDDMSNTMYKLHMVDNTETLAGTTHAMQQYLLLVDTSEVTDGATNYAYELIVQPDEDKCAALLKRAIEKICPRACKLVITEYQGLSGAFDKSETDVTGEISQESTVTIDLDYTISAPPAYWTYLEANKESSISQYLDVAIYLEQNGNKIALPTGTQVIFNNGSDEPIVGVMQGNAILYRYKDAGIEYDLNELTCDTKITGSIELDFSNADFVGFNSGEYNVVLELLKTKDADFPMGGDVLDTYKLTVKSTAKKNLGFALEPKDLLTLGMNGYLPEESDSGVIDYDMKIDFSDYFNGFGIASSEMNALKDKYFTVEYSIEKKVKDENGKLSYKPYEGNLVKVYFGDSQKANIEDCDGSKVVYKFSEDYIKSGEGEDKYVVSFPYTVKADVDELLKTYEDITNYRVVAKLYLSDSKPTGASETKATESTEGCEIYVSPDATIESTADGMEDFFIFTVAKIKTDLDITQ